SCSDRAMTFFEISEPPGGRSAPLHGLSPRGRPRRRPNTSELEETSYAPPCSPPRSVLVAAHAGSHARSRTGMLQRSPARGRTRPVLEQQRSPLVPLRAPEAAGRGGTDRSVRAPLGGLAEATMGAGGGGGPAAAGCPD